MKPIIPKGWRIVKRGAFIHTGDSWPYFGKWLPTVVKSDEKIKVATGIYIRRITPKEKP